jgi:hypothetical protein
MIQHLLDVKLRVEIHASYLIKNYGEGFYGMKYLPVHEFAVGYLLYAVYVV